MLTRDVQNESDPAKSVSKSKHKIFIFLSLRNGKVGVEYKTKIYTKCMNIAMLVPLFLQRALTYFHSLTFPTSAMLAVFSLSCSHYLEVSKNSVVEIKIQMSLQNKGEVIKQERRENEQKRPSSQKTEEHEILRFSGLSHHCWSWSFLYTCTSSRSILCATSLYLGVSRTPWRSNRFPQTS